MIKTCSYSYKYAICKANFFYYSMQSTIGHIMSNKFLQIFQKISFRDKSYHVCDKANHVCDIMYVTLYIMKVKSIKIKFKIATFRKYIKNCTYS